MLEEKVNSLLTLLEDSDPAIVQIVKKELNKLDTDALPFLEEGIFKHPDMRFEIDRIIRSIKQRTIITQISNWLKSPNDLLDVLFIFAQLEYPNLKVKKAKQEIDKLVKEIWIEINDQLTAVEKISVVNHILFQKHRFKVMPWLSRTPESFMINYLLKKRTGSDLIISMLYLYITKELKMDVFGVAVPEHNLLAYYDSSGFCQHTNIERSNVLFYINPANNGAISGRQEIEHSLIKKGYTPDNQHFALVTEKFYLKKMIQELKHSYELLDNTLKADAMEQLMLLFDKKKYNNTPPSI